MKTIKVATLAGLVALVQAQNGDFIITNSDFDLVAGEEFTLEWTGNEGPVTIRLQTGPEDNLETVEVLAEGQTGDSFTWVVPEDIADNTYNFQIEDETTGEVNYSMQFPLDGDDSAVSATPSAPTSAEASATPSDLSTTSAPLSTSSAVASSVESDISSAISSAVSSEISSATESEASSSVSETASATESEEPVPTEFEDVDVPDSKAGRLGSPLALLGLTVAALFYFQ